MATKTKKDGYFYAYVCLNGKGKPMQDGFFWKQSDAKEWSKNYQGYTVEKVVVKKAA